MMTPKLELLATQALWKSNSPKFIMKLHPKVFAIPILFVCGLQMVDMIAVRIG